MRLRDGRAPSRGEAGRLSALGRGCSRRDLL